MKIRDFLAKMFSTSPEVSSGRVAALLSLVFCLGWDTAIIVFVMRHFQDLDVKVADLYPTGLALGAQTAFCVAWLAATKGADVIDNAISKKEQEKNS